MYISNIRSMKSNYREYCELYKVNLYHIDIVYDIVDYSLI